MLDIIKYGNRKTDQEKLEGYLDLKIDGSGITLLLTGCNDNDSYWVSHDYAEIITSKDGKRLLLVKFNAKGTPFFWESWGTARTLDGFIIRVHYTKIEAFKEQIASLENGNDHIKLVNEYANNQKIWINK